VSGIDISAVFGAMFLANDGRPPSPPIQVTIFFDTIIKPFYFLLTSICFRPTSPWENSAKTAPERLTEVMCAWKRCDREATQDSSFVQSIYLAKDGFFFNFFFEAQHRVSHLRRFFFQNRG
jgi:hypothetical protein